MAANKRLVDKLAAAPGWSITQRYEYDLVDSEGNLIQTVWLKPLTLMETAKARDNAKDNQELSLRMLVQSVYLQKVGGERAFEFADVPKLKRELSATMINEVEMAILQAGKPPDNYVKEEKKD